MSDTEYLRQQYFEIGRALNRSALGSEPPVESLVAQGNRWFINNVDLLRRQICTENVRKRLQDETDPEKILTIIIDTLSSIVIYVPVASVSRIIARLGVNQLCQNSIPSD